MGTDTLQIRFDSHEALRSEFDKNIANRGIFVATAGTFEVRQTVTVEVILDYAEGRPNGRSIALALEGEVVHCVPVEMAANGATAGVAVQLEASAQVLRERFEPLLGSNAIAEAESDSEGKKRRSARRGSVRVPIRVIRKNQSPIEMTSRDLSATGVLLSMKDSVLPVGEILSIGLRHPSGQPEVEVTGKVVRHVPNKRGKVAAVAIAFDQKQVEETEVKPILEALREAGHQSQLGGITGSLSDLGLASMLQMFSASAPQGTIVIENEGEQGWVAFAEEQLLGAELGVLSGRDALVAMLRWTEGQFQFEASVNAMLSQVAPIGPLSGAVFEAVCVIDEEKSGAPREIDADLVVIEEGETPGAAAAASAKSTVEFEVDSAGLDETASDDEFEIDVGEIDDLQHAFEDTLRDEDEVASSGATSLVDPAEDDEFVIVVDDAESFGNEDVFASEEMVVEEQSEGAAETELDKELNIEVEAAIELELEAESAVVATPAGPANDSPASSAPVEAAKGEAAPDSESAAPEIVELSLTDTVDESVEWADEPPPEEISIDAETTFTINSKREAKAASSLDKTQSAILDLARAGMNVDRFFDVIPESEEQIQFALVSLVELRVLIPR